MMQFEYHWHGRGSFGGWDICAHMQAAADQAEPAGSSSIIGHNMNLRTGQADKYRERTNCCKKVYLVVSGLVSSHIIVVHRWEVTASMFDLSALIASDRVLALSLN